VEHHYAEICEVARARHSKFGNTIFHLEPNLKECPAGCATTTSRLVRRALPLEDTKEWPRQRGGVFQSARGDAEAAFDFLAAARCFSALRTAATTTRSDWQSQDEAAALSIGLETRGTADPAYWMRPTTGTRASSIAARRC